MKIKTRVKASSMDPNAPCDQNHRNTRRRLSVATVCAALAGCYGAPETSAHAAQSQYVPEPVDNSDNSNNNSGGGNAGDSVTTAGYDIENCSNAEETDIQRAGNLLVRNWSIFEAAAAERGISLSDCLQNRFVSNGDVRCDPTCAQGVAGHACSVGLVCRQANLCADWRADVNAFSSQNKRVVCYGQLIAHELSHTCWATEDRAEIVDGAARAALNAVLGTSFTEADCLTDR